MNIFVDDLEFEDVNFDVYYDDDGEVQEIQDLSEKELVNILSTLERQIRMLPEHYNVEIWEKYKEICKNTLEEVL